MGLFDNQPGDQLLKAADCILTVGFNPAEYDPEVWHTGSADIFHLDSQACSIRSAYNPSLECIGDIAKSLDQLKSFLPACSQPKNAADIKQLQASVLTHYQTGRGYHGLPVHPLRFIYELRETLDDQAIVISDVGSHYMWLARYFWSFEPRHLLFSNGQQTLGVALPWAIGAFLANPKQQIISISGDGGFLFSAMEMETAVRLQANFIHFVWCDGHYDMVKEQQEMKYQRETAVKFGHVDLVCYAEAFGATGIRLEDPSEIAGIINSHRAAGPVLVEVPIDYSNNASLFAAVQKQIGN